MPKIIPRHEVAVDMSEDYTVSQAEVQVLQEHVDDEVKILDREYGNVSLDGNSSLWQGNNYGVVTHHHHYYSEQRQKRQEKSQQDEDKTYQMLLDSLPFTHMNARMRNIAAALPDTCQWLYLNAEFLKWTKYHPTDGDRGFLLIRGKPGSGKSTIMKEVTAWAEKTWQQCLVFTYFFNARSPDVLEKSSLGFYRSFVHRLLTTLPWLHHPFMVRFASKVQRGVSLDDWTATELQNFLLEIASTQKFPSLTIIVDALDEGDEEDIRQLVDFLEEFAPEPLPRSTALRVCLSSRHYPWIHIEGCCEIVLDGQVEHVRDIEKYVDRKLLGKSNPQTDEFRHQICQRSRGIFLWAVLVVSRLNKLYAQGKPIALRMNVMTTIPQDLEDVFIDILSQDEEDVPECIALFRWVLFSRRPLKPRELYAAVQLSLPYFAGIEATPLDEIERYLLNCSRGLVELVSTGLAYSVQFIHETVRDFLLKRRQPIQKSTRGSFLQDADFSADSCNIMMAEACLKRLVSLPWKTSLSRRTCDQSSYGVSDDTRESKSHGQQSGQPTVPKTSYRLFRGYSAAFWWKHIQLSTRTPSQRMLALAHEAMRSKAVLRLWRAQCLSAPNTAWASLLEGSVNEECPPPLCFAASLGFLELVSFCLRREDRFNVLRKWYNIALRVAAFNGHVQIVHMLVDNDVVDFTQLELSNAFLSASATGRVDIAQLLMDKGTDLTPIHRSIENTLSNVTFRGCGDLANDLLTAQFFNDRCRMLPLELIEEYETKILMAFRGTEHDEDFRSRLKSLGLPHFEQLSTTLARYHILELGWQYINIRKLLRDREPNDISFRC